MGWRRTAIAAAGLLVAASLSGGPVLAQPSDQPAVWVEATGDGHPCLGFGAPAEYEESGSVSQIRGSVLECDLDLGDPRLHGDADMTFNYYCHDVGGCVRWGNLDLHGPEGTWSGTYRGVDTPFDSGASFSADIVELAGGGAYEGWSYLGQAANQFSSAPQWFGVLYPGTLPPMSALSEDGPRADG
jgi:hypothetical protein